MKIDIYVAYYGNPRHMILSRELDSSVDAINYYRNLNMSAIFDMWFAIKPCHGWQVVAEIEGDEYWDCKVAGEL